MSISGPLLLTLALACQPTLAPVDTSPACEEEIPYDGLDQDCDGSDLSDVDGDGQSPPADCDDNDPARFPSAEEIPYDGVDQDCDGSDADDLDGDGYLLLDDCDDTNSEVNPSAVEVCNGIDDDCDGSADAGATDATLWYADTDADGFGDPDVTELSCEPQGVTDATDCDDRNPGIYPGAPEVCDDWADNNCDGYVDQMVAGVTHDSVQGALDAACAEGDTVWVSPGTYFENVEITAAVVLEAIESAETTTLDGSLCTRGPDQCGVIRIGASQVTVRGLHITHGSADLGGGIFAEYVDAVRVEENIMDLNLAWSRGGGIYFHCSGTVTRNEVLNNQAGLGGGLYVKPVPNAEGVGVTIEANEIIGNLATSGGGGGYENAFTAQALWTSNDIRDNTAVWGGGIQSQDGLRTMGNTIQDNNASTQGGGLWYTDEWIGSGDTITGNAPDDVYRD